MPPKRKLRDADAAQAVVAVAPMLQLEDDDDGALQRERAERMARNAERLAAIGLSAAVESVAQAASQNAAPKARKPRAQRPRAHVPTRRSGRIAGQAAPEVPELDDDGNPILRHTAASDDDDDDDDGQQGEGLLDLLRGGDAAECRGEGSEAVAAVASTSGRSFKYDKVFGTSCHFCRQKVMCLEPGCPRCVKRDADAACVGKTSCARCNSANGIFCRACISVRYGQTLEEVRADPSWLCPHCYEEEHGPWREHGWFCNSSFCMRRRGINPTGIAIHEARAQGFTSVAHMLQARVLAMEAKREAKRGAKAEQGQGGGGGEQGQQGAAGGQTAAPADGTSADGQQPQQPCAIAHEHAGAGGQEVAA